MTYAEKLLDPLWKAKRHWIIRRDDFKCTKCAKTNVNFILRISSIRRGNTVIEIPQDLHFVPEHRLELNVHHKYYHEGKEPWEYVDSALTTLCPDCHKNEHENSVIPFYLKSGEITEATICSRCQGAGYLPEFSHVLDGICFQCWGEGVEIDDLNVD